MTGPSRHGATVLDSIGSTPLIQIDDIWVKLEYLNPSGSIKARMARYIIERAEREGLLMPGDTIVEASSGNTGNAMSMVAAVTGYKMLVVMPEGLSPERTAISVAFGAQVHYVGDFHVNDFNTGLFLKNIGLSTNVLIGFFASGPSIKINCFIRR